MLDVTTKMISGALVRDVKAVDGKVPGLIEGYASTFWGEPDAVGDIVAAGAFKDSLKEHAKAGTTPKMLWYHDMSKPIGKWLEMKEDDHGLWVRGQINLDVQRGAETYALIKAGDIDGLSIGYRIRKHSVDDDTGVWTLEKLDLIEVSVVTIGANSNATITDVKALRREIEIIEKLAAGDRLTEREFETMLKGLGLSNSQAERAARVHLKGAGEPRDKAENGVLEFLRALAA